MLSERGPVCLLSALRAEVGGHKVTTDRNDQNYIEVKNTTVTEGGILNRMRAVMVNMRPGRAEYWSFRSGKIFAGRHIGNYRPARAAYR